MPQSLSKVVLHVVFSTKERFPFLDAGIRPGLHGYMATVCRGIDASAEAYRVGGVSDHVHVACRLPRTVPTAKLVEELKTASSKWIKQQGEQYAKFFWQRGYGAFSINPGELDGLIRYIDQQEDHHEKESFQDEYRRFLNQNGIDYDERYVWD